MGKIEKLIVLGVLLLITIILVVTFSPEESTPVHAGGGSEGDLLVAERISDLDQATGTGNKHTADDRIRPSDLAANIGANDRSAADLEFETLPGPAAEDLDVPADAPGPASEPRGGSPLLSTGVQVNRDEPAAIPPATEIPEGSILIATAGLQDSFLEDFKLYRWSKGDDYRGLAARFYGDANRANLLRQYNEDRHDVQPGQQIFVPVFAVEGDAEPDPEPALAGETWVVQEGENLWSIAKDHLGAGSKWQKLHEANLDVLPDPHKVRPGMRLRIPQ